jgi:hypothetical protein
MDARHQRLRVMPAPALGEVAHTPACFSGRCAVSESDELRGKATRSFRLARSITDAKAVEALEELGREFQRKAAELERREMSEGEREPPSRS